MHIKRLFKNTKRFTLSESKGDTMIEVLISIAIISLVLTISYALSNRNSQYIQQSQERGEAQKISEQQLELLRNYLTSDTDWNASHYLCFDDGDPATNTPPQPTTNIDDCNKGIQDNGVGRYNTIIAYDSTTATYTVNTAWSSLTSVPQQALAISYKLPASLFTPDQFLLPPGSTVTVIAKKIPSRAPDGSSVASAGNANPSCTDSGRQDKSGTNVQARYIDIDGNPAPWQAGATDTSSTHIFPGFQNYGKFESKVTAPAGYSVCGLDTKQDLLLRPETNLDFNFVIKPNCTVSNDFLETVTHPILETVWIQDVPIWDNVAILGWAYQSWFWWSYWPPGYTSTNPPYNTVFQSGLNRLDLWSVRYGHHNANYQYGHYLWTVTGYSWQIVGWGWRSKQVQTGTWDEHIYELRNHCPS